MCCGKYKKKRFQNVVCDRCVFLEPLPEYAELGWDISPLAVPIAHIWFVKSTPSKIGTLAGYDR
jgi:DNA-directed RNA polymerase subunit beta'